MHPRSSPARFPKRCTPSQANGSMFRRIDTPASRLRFQFDGNAIEAAEGETLAAALLAAGISSLRETPVTGAPRAPYCMMGVCFDCLVEVDGVPNRQAC